MDGYKLKLSKFLSYLLRHQPAKYELKLDKNGYADLEKILGILEKRFKYFKREDLFNLVKNEPKGRFEIIDNKIRATYGHSIEVYPKTESIIPPEILYHGTSDESLEKILQEGLKPMGRQFVHLSLNEKDAYAVGLRHTKKPVILKIMARGASLDGIKFFRKRNLFLVKSVPKHYIIVP